MSGECAALHGLFGPPRRRRCPYGADLPKNGLYVLFEEGETGHGGERIVRVGSHRGPGRLAGRLDEHFVNENKDRSIFRKHIGRALLAKAGDPFAPVWEIDLMTRAAKDAYGASVDRGRLADVERSVTEYMRRAFSFAVLGTGENDERLGLEARLIATVAQCRECGPSAGWLGRHHPDAKVRRGLWQSQHLGGPTLTGLELDRLHALAASA